MNLNRARHIVTHNLCEQIRREKIAPTPKGTSNKMLEFWKIIDKTLAKATAQQILKDEIGILTCPSCGNRKNPITGFGKYCDECGQKLEE